MSESLLAVDPFSGPLTASTTQTSASSDFSATDDLIDAILDVGAVTGTLPTLIGKVQNSPDGVTWTDCNVASPTGLGTVTASGVYLAAYQRDYQYVRFVGTIAGTTPSFPFAALIVGQKKKI